MLGTEFQDMLRCIRCGACLNHCPVYQAVGGHAYGWVYPGPIGSVVTPALIGIEKAKHLPNASTFCGRCEEVCPMRIPLPKMLRHWREKEFEQHLQPQRHALTGLGLWAFLAKRPKLYRMVTRLAARVLHQPGPRQRPHLQPAAGIRLDAMPRLPGAAGQDLPADVEGAAHVSRVTQSSRRSARAPPRATRRPGA